MAVILNFWRKNKSMQKAAHSAHRCIGPCASGAHNFLSTNAVSSIVSLQRTLVESAHHLFPWTTFIQSKGRLSRSLCVVLVDLLNLSGAPFSFHPCVVRNISIWCVVEEVSARSLQVTKGPRRAGDNARVASLKVTMAPHRLSNPLTEGPTWDHLGHQQHRTNMQTGTRTDMAPQRQLFQVRFLVLLITVVHWICTYMAVTFESFLWSVQWLMVLLIQKGKLQEFVFLLLLRNFTCESVCRLLCKVLSACLKVYDFFYSFWHLPWPFRSKFIHCVTSLCRSFMLISLASFLSFGCSFR